MAKLSSWGGLHRRCRPANISPIAKVFPMKDPPTIKSVADKDDGGSRRKRIREKVENEREDFPGLAISSQSNSDFDLIGQMKKGHFS